MDVQRITIAATDFAILEDFAGVFLPRHLMIALLGKMKSAVDGMELRAALATVTPADVQQWVNATE